MELASSHYLAWCASPFLMNAGTAIWLWLQWCEECHTGCEETSSRFYSLGSIPRAAVSTKLSLTKEDVWYSLTLKSLALIGKLGIVV